MHTFHLYQCLDCLCDFMVHEADVVDHDDVACPFCMDEKGVQYKKDINVDEEVLADVWIQSLS